MENEFIFKLLKISSFYGGTSKFISFGCNIEQTLDFFEKSSKKCPSEEIIWQKIENAQKCGAKIIPYNSALYPISLLKIRNFPLVLYAKGNCNLLERKNIFGIVGSRLASNDSIKLATQFAIELSKANFCITSGFANGVDSAACFGAKDYGTIQVLGSGVDVIYPKQNEKLYREVLDSGGLFISEIECNKEPQSRFFPSRNRIISGISCGILLVQAGLIQGSSGSLITAKFACEQGKYVFAIPGSPLDPRFNGCNQLIKNGDAFFTICPEDITSIISSKPKIQQKQQQDEFLYEEGKEEDDNLLSQNTSPNPTKDEILSTLSPIPSSLDDICNTLNYQDEKKILSILSMLELDGLCKKTISGFIR